MEIDHGSESKESDQEEGHQEDGRQEEVRSLKDEAAFHRKIDAAESANDTVPAKAGTVVSGVGKHRRAA